MAKPTRRQRKHSVVLKTQLPVRGFPTSLVQTKMSPLEGEVSKRTGFRHLDTHLAIPVFKSNFATRLNLKIAKKPNRTRPHVRSAPR
jgi:hypothetical protein